MTEHAPLCTWSGHDDSGLARTRCGAAICEHCAGPTRGDRCTDCERSFGTFPWAETRSLFAWAGTMRSILTRATDSLLGAPREGPVAPAVAFALIAIVIRVVGSGLVFFVDRLAETGDGRRLRIVGPLVRLAGICLTTPAALATLTLVVAAVGAILATRIPMRACISAMAYLAGWLAVSWVPSLGWFALLPVWAAVHGWLRREGNLGAGSAFLTSGFTIAVALFVGLCVDVFTANQRHEAVRGAGRVARVIAV